MLEITALLLARAGSGTSDATLALSLIVPGVEVEVFTVTVMLALPAESIVPKGQVKVEPLWLQETDELTQVVVTGSVSVNTTFVAACGPAL